MIDNIDCNILSLNEEEKNYIRKSGTLSSFPKGKVIFSEGDVADRIYFIEEGFVKIYRMTKDGRRITVGSMRSTGQLMGLAEALYQGERTCFAGAINDVTMIIVRRENFFKLLMNNPTITIKVATTLGMRMREAEEIIQEMVFFQVPGRLAMLLLKMARLAGVETSNGTKIGFRLTHEEIAYMIGTSRQTVTTLLNLFQKEHSIAIEGKGKGKEVYILDIEKLNKWDV